MTQETYDVLPTLDSHYAVPADASPSAINADAVREVLDALYRLESWHIFATLVRLLGDFDVAEEALHDAFRAALEQWPSSAAACPPTHAPGWFRPGVLKSSTVCAAVPVSEVAEPWDDKGVEDDRLRLIFTAAIRHCRRMRKWR